MQSISKKRNLTLVFTVALLLFASASFACGGYWGYGYGAGNARLSMTADQQQKMDAVKGKYSQQLTDLQVQLDKKAENYRAARADDATTVATLNRLEGETADLQRQYRALVEQANAEAGLDNVNGYGPGWCWSNNGGNYRCGMYSGRHMGPGPGWRMGYDMDGTYPGCGWW